MNFRGALQTLFAKAPKPQTADERTPSTQILNADSIAWAEVSAMLADAKYNPDDLIGRKGFDIYKRMLFDEAVKSAMYFKRGTITGREWFFELDPEKYKVAEKEAERRVQMFTAMIEDHYSGTFTDGLNSIMKAMWQGFSMTEQMFDIFNHDGADVWGLRELRPKPFETFYPVVNDKGDVLRWVQRGGSMSQRELKIDLTKFVYYRFNADVDEHYGGSDLRAAYRSFLSKDIAIRYRNIFMERLAGGFVTIKPQEGHSITRNSAEWSALREILMNINGKSGIILPSGVDLEIHFASGGQISVFKDSIEQDDQAIARAALIPTLIGVAPSGDTGSYSQADTQFDSFVINSDLEAKRLEDAINEQIFGPLGRVNFADGIAPRFRFKPLSKRRVQAILSMWKDLVSSKAVQPSDTDEAHLRKLMEFPVKGEVLVDPTALVDSTSSPNSPQADDEKRPAPIGRGEKSDETREKREDMAASPHLYDPSIYEHKRLQDLEEEFGPQIPVDKLFVKRAHLFAKRDEMLAAFERTDTDYVLSMDQIVPTQESVDVDKLYRMLHVRDLPPPKVMKKDGFFYLLDGHHRVALANLCGQWTVRVELGVVERTLNLAFSRAIKRVAFAVIGRQAQAEHERYVDQLEDALAEVVAEAVARVELGGVGGRDSDEEIGKFTLDGNKMRLVERTIASSLRSGMDIGASHAKREVTSARGATFSRKMDMRRLGDMASDWMRQKSFTIAGDLKAGVTKEIKSALTKGLKQGSSHEQIKLDIYRGLVNKGVLGGRAAREALGAGDKEDLAQLLQVRGGLEPHRLDTVIRTNMFEAINEARLNTFTDPEMGDFVVGLEYSAILDSRTTAVCAHMDGKAYSGERWQSDLRPWVPPNHFNCRSILVPITQLDDDQSLDEDEPTIQPQEGF